MIELHTWELVDENELTVTFRMKVAFGWLYRVVELGEDHAEGPQHVVHVSDPASSAKEKEDAEIRAWGAVTARTPTPA